MQTGCNRRRQRNQTALPPQPLSRERERGVVLGPPRKRRALFHRKLRANAKMTTDQLLESLSRTEKIALMERLWADLSQRPQEVPSPDWHGDVLAERIAAVREGRTALVDWNDAKRRLRDRLE